MPAVFPYFETLIEHLKRGDTVVQRALGRHVHWGYWEKPRAVPQSPEAFHRAAEAMLERMVKKAAVRSGIKVLDVGCGLGGTINFLNNEYSYCTLIGVNLNRNQLEIARRETVNKNRNLVYFIQTDACYLPFSTEIFDVIFCIESIFHFRDRLSFFRECHRLLKPGGVLVISDFVPIKYFGKLLNYAERKTRLVGKMYGEIHADISKSQYRTLSRSIDMQCVSIEDVTSNTLPTYRFLKANLHRTEKRNVYNRATFLIELVSRMRLVRYLILAFRKPDRE